MYKYIYLYICKYIILFLYISNIHSYSYKPISIIDVYMLICYTYITIVVFNQFLYIYIYVCMCVPHTRVRMLFSVYITEIDIPHTEDTREVAQLYVLAVHLWSFFFHLSVLFIYFINRRFYCAYRFFIFYYIIFSRRQVHAKLYTRT